MSGRSAPHDDNFEASLGEFQGMKICRPRILLHPAAVLLAFVCGCWPAQLGAQEGISSAAETIVINTQARTHPFPHYWENIFGSGRAILSLRASYREDLRSVKRVTDFQYVRFHGIFDREAGLYYLNVHGKPEYNFSYVDQIYDGLLANGIRPYVELSFMPKDLASTLHQQSFYYHPYVSPPKDWNLWGDLIHAFVQHLVNRYGLDEVSKWYFEVWNEPNIDFWAGEPKQATYFHLYDVAARAIKSISPRLRVGGPSTAATGWVSVFIHHCSQDQVPVDFVSTHVYGNNTSEEVFGTHEQISGRDMVAIAVKEVHDRVKASEMPNLPIIFSEFNASWRNKTDITDSSYMGPWLAETISRCDGLVDTLSYWDFSDVFEEQGVAKKPFYGGFGLIATGHIDKASYNDFALLHRLGRERLDSNPGPVIVTRRDNGELAIALWNYAPPGNGGTAKRFNLSFQGLSGAHRAIIWSVYKNHGSPLATWIAMGSPAFPGVEQADILRQAGQLPAPQIEEVPQSNSVLSLSLEPHALSLIEIVK